MKKLTILMLILPLMSCTSKNNEQAIVEPKAYTIGTTTWYYALPKEYMLRDDDFNENREIGDKVIEENGGSVSNDVFLVSATRNKNSDRNTLVVTYTDNDQLQQFGLEGYRDQVLAFIKKTFESMGAICESEAGEVLIDSVKFYTAESKIFDKDSTYIYNNITFISEISGKSVSMVATFDNEDDKDLLINSLLNSTFKED